MPVKSSQVFFVDTYTPNEGEPGLSLEIGVLRWSIGSAPRPEVYVHSYLKPALTPNRFRWSNAQVEMKISHDFIENNDLPTIDDVVEADYLKGRIAVCFDPLIEPIYSLVGRCTDVISILKIWQEIFIDDEKALACTTLDSMCNYIGMLPDDKENTNYTPLLKRLYKTACLWFFLDELLKNPKARRNIGSGGMQFNLIWPLPKNEETWFKDEKSCLAQLTADEIKDFFNENLDDRINWFTTSMYACDWLFHRVNKIGVQDLVGKNDLAVYVFEHVLDFKMQMWVLIFYSLYQHKLEQARQIALDGGSFRNLKPATVENFSNFIIENLDVFLSPKNKNRLIASLINQSLQDRDKHPFAHYDYETLKKEQQENRDGPKLILTDNNPSNSTKASYKEVRNAQGYSIYRYYEVKGRGKDRARCVESVVAELSKLYEEAQNQFSDIWITPDLKLWIQYITGVTFSEIARTPRANDAYNVKEARVVVLKIIEREAAIYLTNLYRKIKELMELIRDPNTEVEPICFNFQGISLEVKIVSQTKVGLLSRIFSFS